MHVRPAAAVLHEELSLVDALRRLELALLQTDDEALIDLVRSRLGNEEVMRLQAVQQLKPVPDVSGQQYVPRSSRGWVWY